MARVSPEVTDIIRAKMNRYCRSVDSKQWDLFNTVSFPDASFAYRNPDGSFVRAALAGQDSSVDYNFKSREEFLNFFKSTFDSLNTIHMVDGGDFEQVGPDEVKVVFVIMYMAGPNGKIPGISDGSGGGHYHQTWKRDGDDWFISTLDFVIDSYLCYKSGIKRIFKWLVAAARLCDPNLRLGDEQTPGSKNTRRMPLARYAELAQIIASSTHPKIQVTPRLLSILRDVISLRKAFSLMYQQEICTDEAHSRSNESHQYLISLLEEIWWCLEPLRAHEDRSNATEPDDSPPNKTGGNIFDVLDVEDIEEPGFSQDLVQATTPSPSDAKIRAQSKGKSKGKGKTKSKNNDYEYDETAGPSTSQHELYFMLFCFFKDLNDVRSYLRNTWEDYRDGKTPLVTAAVVTDLAFDVVQRKEREFLDTEITSEERVITVKQGLSDLQEAQTNSGIGLYWRGENGNDGMESSFIGDLLFGFIAGARQIGPAADNKGEDGFDERK
ncbi:Uu.00g004510.m01.CDS01 [Anthostomella pinea]|uniref:Uu.00g004510.m01.CDS01 n=1 Tax=Anthostomella pinea TaxID=933095 RepID=A0AAI8VJZ1_9PEZI|nr:Uu.00g004510.m01.CDS01 [Anthostomella pinea]